MADDGQSAFDTPDRESPTSDSDEYQSPTPAPTEQADRRDPVEISTDEQRELHSSQRQWQDREE